MGITTMNISFGRRAVLAFLISFAGLSAAAAGPEAVAATPTPTSETAAAITPVQKKAGDGQTKQEGQGKPKKATLKPAGDKKAGAPDGTSAISPSVANANAELPSPGTPLVNTARAMSARATSILNAATTQTPQVLSADPLNELDLALQEKPAPKPMLAMAAADAPIAPIVSVAPRTNGNSAWEQTSLIGKIFIGFGALLTVASAARLFIA